MRSVHIVRRHGKRFGFIIGALLLLCVIGVLIAYFFPRKQTALRRVNVVLATSPMSVWSWDRIDGTFTVVTLSSDSFIDAVHGYGKYSLDALWKLGFIEDGSILASSLSYALGLPISWYIGPTSEELLPATDTVSTARTLFSVSNTARFAFGGNRTNMPISLYISFVRALSAARSDKINHIDLVRQPVTFEEPVPDGSSRPVIDQERIDAVLKGVFEDPEIRHESVSVALYNTTQTPALGSKAARLLTQLGVLVVSVGNEEAEVKRCIIEGADDVLTSETARSIADVFDCQRVTHMDKRRTDLTVKIGSDFAALFEPRRKKDNP